MGSVVNSCPVLLRVSAMAWDLVPNTNFNPNLLQHHRLSLPFRKLTPAIAVTFPKPSPKGTDCIMLDMTGTTSIRWSDPGAICSKQSNRKSAFEQLNMEMYRRFGFHLPTAVLKRLFV
jgi:hypothetical protein